MLARILVSAAVGAALVAPAGAWGAAPAPKLDWKPCASEAAEGFDCATLRAPLDYDRPDGATIRVAAIRHRATDRAHRIGTLFFNPGGPGSGTAGLPQYLSAGYFPPALRARFDIVSWDPRAIGDSTAVQCFRSQGQEKRFLGGVGIPGDSFPVGKAQKARWIERYRSFGPRCEHANGKLLRHVSTADGARDLNLLRRAADERKLRYIGISYGTVLGATYANLFPDRVGKVVLDGDVVPTAWAHEQVGVNDGRFLNTWLREHSDRGAAKTLKAFLGLCGRAGTARCAFSAGTADATRGKFDALLHRLRTDPESADISYADLVSAITSKVLYNTALWPQGGECLQKLWTTGHWCASAATSKAPIPGVRSMRGTAAGQRETYSGPEQPLAIICSESPNPRPATFLRLDTFARERSGAPGPYWSWGSEACASWPAVAPDRYRGPWDRRTANPILVVGNTHDPATPLRNAVAMAHELARARLLTMHGYGHTALSNPSACIQRYESRYFIGGALPPKGATCEQPQPFGAGVPDSGR